MAEITIVNGVYKPTYNWGAPSCIPFIRILRCVAVALLQRRWSKGRRFLLPDWHVGNVSAPVTRDGLSWWIFNGKISWEYDICDVYNGK